MTVYMTKVWGFDVPCGPLQFSISGFRDSAADRLQPGDLVVLVGTKTERTQLADRGRVLGLVEPSTERVRSLDFEFNYDPNDYDEHGAYRWPFALLNRRAWQIVGPPVMLAQISQRQFQMDSALGIVPLDAEEATAVLNLPRNGDIHYFPGPLLYWSEPLRRDGLRRDAIPVGPGC
jgi:hypothetical protein